jgi:hypothetical protein
VVKSLRVLYEVDAFSDAHMSGIVKKMLKARLDVFPNKSLLGKRGDVPLGRDHVDLLPRERTHNVVPYMQRQ